MSTQSAYTTAVSAATAKSGLARSASTSSVTQVPTGQVMEACIVSGRLPALLVAVRTQRLTLEALTYAYKKVEIGKFCEAMLAEVQHQQCCNNQPTTLLHTIFRFAHWRLLQFVVNECIDGQLPKDWWDILEPGTGSTIMHVMAQRSPGSDTYDFGMVSENGNEADENAERKARAKQAEDRKKYRSFVKQMMVAVSKEQLITLDKYKCTVVHYLAVNGYREALDQVEVMYPGLIEERGTAANGTGTPLSLLSRRNEHSLLIAQQENVQLRQNLEQAEITARDLRTMHEALNTKIERGQLGAELAQHKLDDTTREQAAQNLRRAELDALVAMKSAEAAAMRSERDNARAAAEEARANFEMANQRLAEYEAEREVLRQQLADERAKIQHSEEELEQIEAANIQLMADMKRRRIEYEELSTSVVNETAQEAEARQAKLQADFEQQKRALDERVARIDAERRSAQLARDQLETKISKSDAEQQMAERLQLEAQQRSATLEQQLEEANERQRATLAQVQTIRESLDNLRADQAAAAERYQRQLGELATERERLTAQLRDSQGMLQSVQLALEEERAQTRARLAEIDNAAAIAVADGRVVTADDKEAVRAEIVAQSSERERTLVEQLEQMQRLTAVNEKRAQEMEQRDRESAALLQELQVRHSDEVRVMAQRLEETSLRLVVAQRRATQGEAQTNEARQLLESRDAQIKQLEQELADKSRLIGGGGGGSLDSPRREAKQQRGTLARVASRSFGLGGSGENPNGATSSTNGGGGGSLNGSGRSARPRSIMIMPDVMDTAGIATTGLLPKPANASLSMEEREIQGGYANMRLNQEFWNSFGKMVAEGNVSDVTVLLNYGISANSRDYLNEPLLEVAVRAIHDLYVRQQKQTQTPHDKDRLKKLVQMIPLLLQRGAEWSELDEYVRSIGEDAIPSSVYDMLRRRDDMSPFCLALARKDFPRAAEFIDKVEDLDRVPTHPKKHFSELFSYLHIAVIGESATLVQMMVQRRVNVGARDRKGRTPLHLLLVKCKDRKQRLLIAEFLLAGGADPESECGHKKLIDKCRGRMKDLSTTTTSSGGDGGNAMNKLSQDVSKYSKPIKLAESWGDTELVQRMTSRRYLAVSQKTLAGYIVQWAQLQALMELALAEGLCGDDSVMYKMYKRYKDVFLAFNPRHNYQGFIAQLHLDALVSRASDSPATIERKMAEMLDNDAKLIAIEFMKVGGKPAAAEAPTNQLEHPTLKTHGNATYQWKIGKMLQECIFALEQHWFDVSNMISQPATDMYPEATLAALCTLVRADDALAVNAILGRPMDRLFGDDVNVKTVIDLKNRYTSIELAAFCGSINVLESLLPQQRNDIYVIGASGRTLPQIAGKGSQPLSLVAIDHFMFKNQMTDEQHSNADSYGILTEELNNTVLHMAAAASRDDLMRYCIGQVRFQLSRRNKGGQTALQIAEQSIKLGMPTRKLELAKLACKQILLDVLSGKMVAPAPAPPLPSAANVPPTLLAQPVVAIPGTPELKPTRSLRDVSTLRRDSGGMGPKPPALAPPPPLPSEQMKQQPLPVTTTIITAAVEHGAADDDDGMADAGSDNE